MSSSLILPFGWAAEVFQDGTGIQNHKKDKTVPEEREISGCCSACDLPSTTHVGSTKLMEHLEVMESMASRIPLPYRWRCFLEKMSCQEWGWRKVDSLQAEVHLKYSVTSWPEITTSPGSLHGRSIKGLQGVRMVSVYFIALMAGHTRDSPAEVWAEAGTSGDCWTLQLTTHTDSKGDVTNFNHPFTRIRRSNPISAEQEQWQLWTLWEKLFHFLLEIHLPFLLLVWERDNFVLGLMGKT